MVADVIGTTRPARDHRRGDSLELRQSRYGFGFANRNPQPPLLKRLLSIESTLYCVARALALPLIDGRAPVPTLPPERNCCAWPVRLTGPEGRKRSPTREQTQIFVFMSASWDVSPAMSLAHQRSARFRRATRPPAKRFLVSDLEPSASFLKFRNMSFLYVLRVVLGPAVVALLGLLSKAASSDIAPVGPGHSRRIGGSVEAGRCGPVSRAAKYTQYTKQVKQIT